MIYVVVTLNVKNFTALDVFEREALSHLRDVGGELLCAVETIINEDGTGQEVHVLSFPNADALETYKNITNTARLNELRALAIENSDLKVSTKIKRYV